MKKQIALILFLFVAICVKAQTINVKGVVKDATTGDTLPGVSVVIKGTTIKTPALTEGCIKGVIRKKVIECLIK